MNESRIIINDAITKFLEADDYANAVKILLKQQLEEWDQLAEGYDCLSNTKKNSFWFEGFKINLQYNAGRLKSTSANVDRNAINDRKCFLCNENLPPEQKGIKLLGNYLILCNPHPIFPEHFTIVSNDHQPQQILTSFNDFILIGKMLSDNYSVIYNGPMCGASAPDHLHFQAVTKNFMPIENDFHSLKNEYGTTLFDKDEVCITAMDDGIRRFLSIETKDENLLLNSFKQIYNICDTLSSNNEEPMINLICSYDGEYGWRIIIFLRSKHRSSHYYLKGEDKITISPAAIDLGGLCIAPIEKDFERVDKELLAEIFKEVSIFKEGFDYITNTLKKSFGP